MDSTTYSALGNPNMGFFTMLLVGVLAGWIAEKITESRHGLFTNLLVGIAGSFVGGKIAELLNVPVFGFFRTLVAAVIGAVLVLWIWRKVRGQPQGY
ncbi:GlsB/YeaQ/YmgE family stress response membrane protein [Alsobacter sp. KACC 23698]|uniref:GlsB/YeaQ/YmgE family stress response membrane protein n=1 Tax=Alsobacter sp. KACC 23698 TaxID=3149229 RepID=A0AAU7JMA4_9HYPH